MGVAPSSPPGDHTALAVSANNGRLLAVNASRWFDRDARAATVTGRLALVSETATLSPEACASSSRPAYTRRALSNAGIPAPRLPEDASITALAQKFHMTLTGMKKHVGVLEQAGLVTTEKVGRVRTCRLGLRGLQEEAQWIERHRQLWSARFGELDAVVAQLKRKERADGRKARR